MAKKIYHDLMLNRFTHFRVVGFLLCCGTKQFPCWFPLPFDIWGFNLITVVSYCQQEDNLQAQSCFLNSCISDGGIPALSEIMRFLQNKLSLHTIWVACMYIES